MSELRGRVAIATWACCCYAGCSPIDTVAWPAIDAGAAVCDTRAAHEGVLDDGDRAIPPVRWPFALCSCDNYVGSAALTVDAFDGLLGPYTQGHAGGSVGLNTDMSLDGLADIGGALAAAGPLGIALGPDAELRVAGTLDCGGDLGGASASAVVRADANIAGSIAVDTLEVNGILTYPADQTLGAGTRVTAGATQRTPVSVALPCPCAPDEVFDTAAAVALRRTDDGAAAFVGEADLEAGAVRSLALPCGRSRLPRLDASGDLELQVEGRSALYVDGDIAVGGAVRVTLAPDAALDLFVAGDLRAGGGLQLGNAAARGLVRLYVGGEGPIEIANTSELHGTLYAPAAELVSSADFTLFGALLVRRVRASASLIIHYDERFAPGE